MQGDCHAWQVISFYLEKIVSGCLLEINRVGQKDKLSVRAWGKQEAQLRRLGSFVAFHIA